MRYAVLLLAASAAIASAQPAAQPAAQMCGAPAAYDARSAGQRLRALLPVFAQLARDPYESTVEWTARVERASADARRTALASFSLRTLRVGGRISARYDADAEEFILGESLPSFIFPDIPFGLSQTKLLREEADYTVSSVASLWGSIQYAPPVPLGHRYPTVSLNRIKARSLDVSNNPACFFVVYRIFGNDEAVLGLDRVEVVSVVHGEPHVWSWTLGDDGTVGSPMPPPPMPPPPPPPPPPPRR